MRLPNWIRQTSSGFPTSSTLSGRAVPDNGGPLRHIELHYTAAAAELLLPTYAALFEGVSPTLLLELKLWKRELWRLNRV